MGVQLRILSLFLNSKLNLICWSGPMPFLLFLLEFKIVSEYDPVIHLQFWAYESWDSLFPILRSPTANLWVQNTIFNDKSAILLHPGTRWNKNFASQRQNYAQKMQDVQVTNSLMISNYYIHKLQTNLWHRKSQTSILLSSCKGTFSPPEVAQLPQLSSALYRASAQVFKKEKH